MATVGNHKMQLGGHRGMGENLSEVGVDGKVGVYPAFRENTVASFQQAAKCGVTFVEFDVQVTRDGVPIIWHDDDVVMGTPDHPSMPFVKDLTLSELQALCSRRPAQVTATATTASDGCTTTTATTAATAAPATSTCSTSSTASTATNNDAHDGSTASTKLLRLFRDRTTRQRSTAYQLWACAEDDAIPTLEAVFAGLPEHIGFDIEVKMTTGSDVEHTPAEEVDRMLAAILPVVERLRGSRKIFFSSFDPDVCTELTRRQAACPVYYLSGCEGERHVDARRTSVKAALSFAASHGMRGIVVPAEVVMGNEGMVHDAADSQLEVMTYGLANNDLGCLQKQADLGVAAAIVDEVAGVTARYSTQHALAA